MLNEVLAETTVLLLFCSTDLLCIMCGLTGRLFGVAGAGVLAAWFVPYVLYQTCAVSESSSLDIVREVAFISADGGNTWTAEVGSLVSYHS